MYITHLQLKFYGIAILSVVLALVLMLMLDPWLGLTQSPFVLFFGAVMVSAWYGSTKAGLLATGLCVILSGYLFVSSTHSLSLDLPDITRLSLFLPQGVLISVLCGTLNKSNRQAEINMRSLAISEERCRCILDTASEGIWIIDSEARTEYVNQRLAQMFGYTREEMLHRPIFDFIDESLHAEATQHINQPQKGARKQFDFRFLRQDKSSLWAIASTNSIFNQQSEFIGSLLMLTDVTEQKQAQQALLEREERLRLAEEALHQTETRFANLAENVPGVICQYRQDPKGIGEFLYISSGCFDLYEIDSNKLRQNPQLAWQVIHPNDFAALKQSLIKYAATGEQWRHEWRIITPSGKIKWIQGTARSQPQANGSLLWNGVLIDISDRKRSEAHFRHIFESNMIGMKFWRGDDEITLANQAYLNIIGYTQEDLQAGRVQLSQITPPEYQSAEQQAKAEIRQKGTCTPYEKEYIRKDGSRIPVLVGGAGLDDSRESGICFVMDMSDRKLLENQLRQQAAELNQANLAKDEFLAVLSHELRTPLTSILGWTQMFRSRKLDEKTKTLGLETIERNANLQKQLIEDLLDISRILQGKLRLNVCPMNLVNVIEAAMRNLRSTAEEKSINLEFAIAQQQLEADFEFEQPGQITAFSDNNDGHVPHTNHDLREAKYRHTLKLPKTQAAKPIPVDNRHHSKDEAGLKSQIQNPKFWVSGDSNRLQQVVYNLLSNAIRFTPKGGRIAITLSVEMEPGDSSNTTTPIANPQSPISNYAQITVSDTGIGINHEFLPHVFDRFRQADNTITRKFGGLGLGLSIVRHLVEMHNGTVTAQSPGEGQGATFTVNLPLLPDTVTLPTIVAPKPLDDANN